MKKDLIQFLKVALVVLLLWFLIFAMFSCSAAKRAERKKKQDMEKFEELLLEYPEIQDTTFITLVDTLIIPEKVIEYRVQYKHDTVYVQKAIDSTLQKLDGLLSDAQQLTLAKDIRTIVLESKHMKDTTLLIDDNVITFKNGAITHTKLSQKLPYDKELTNIQVKPLPPPSPYPFYKKWWFSLIVLALLWLAYQSRKR